MPSQEFLNLTRMGWRGGLPRIICHTGYGHETRMNKMEIPIQLNYEIRIISGISRLWNSFHTILWFVFLKYGTKIPLTQTLSHKGRGNFPSLDLVVSSVERWEGLREGDIFSCSFVSLWLMNVYSVKTSFPHPRSPFPRGQVLRGQVFVRFIYTFIKSPFIPLF